MSIDTETYAELARLVAFETAKLSTSAFYLTDDDSLRLRSFGSLTGVTLALETRLVGPDGRVQAGQEIHTPNTDRTEKVTIFDVGEGFLLSASVRATAAAPRRGQVFAVLDLVRGSTGAVQPLACLLQGYVTDTSRLAWPGSPIQASADGPGVLRSITGTDPAAGLEISETVPANARWRLHAFMGNLVTDGTVANREATLAFDDGTTVYARVPSGFSHVASTGRFYTAGHGCQRFAIVNDGSANLPIPALTLPAGHRIRTLTTGIVAGDNWGAPQFLVEEWIED